jgi:prophage regulatory protein
VKDLTGLSRATIYRYVDAGEFPRPVKIGVRAIAWHASDVDAWIEGREAA